MARVDVASLKEPQATLLTPLWARAEESRREQPILRDEKAAEIIAVIDYDFESFKRRSVPQADYCIRVSIIDRLVSEFLGTHPKSTIVELGVGLDSRYERLDDRWHHQIADLLDEPVLFVAEGVFYFFKDEEVRKMVLPSLHAERGEKCG